MSEEEDLCEVCGNTKNTHPRFCDECMVDHDPEGARRILGALEGR